ncbi:thioredoxin 2 [Thermocatellispora tengchongensis]|uniref:Thioredoxin 2 n=2 Tax=Thermocatellispora tengchongensis TaxID=1073253 RepID=A0A840P365_9ACTN|nr:thioredoxin domain-containing protein [Thermocatellispora tengchongensis]MBB5131920.1 thioredoxin 2 [Thermocatellispora tengchongensis]
MTTATPAYGASIVACDNCGARNRVPAAMTTGSPRCGRCRDPLAWIADADDTTFAAVAERASIPVVVDFMTAWSGTCQAVGPLLERLAHDLAGRIKLVRVDVDRSPGLSQRYSILHVPFLLLLDRDRVVSQHADAAPEPELRRWIEESLAS